MRDNGGVRGPRTPSSKLAFRPNADGYLPGVKPARNRTREPRVREPRVRQPRPERSRERRPAPPPRPPRVRRSRETLPSPRRRRVLRALGAVVVVLLGMVGVLVGVSAWTASKVSHDVERLPNVFPTGDRPAAVPGSLTFLLVGLDTSPGSTPGGEPDMIGLGHVTEDRSHLQMVAMPANLWVDESDDSAGTLRDAFNSAGPQGLIAAVEATSGLRVDHYADLDLAAFSALTEALGGITVDVPDLHRSRGQQFEPGKHEFDGDDALAYMRSPRAEQDEVTAVPRQQQVIRALYERVREQGLLSNLGRLSGLIGLLTRSLRVDDTMDDAFLTGLAWDLRDAGAPELFTVPVKPVAEHDGIPVHAVDRERAEALFTYLRTDLLSEHRDEFT